MFEAIYAVVVHLGAIAIDEANVWAMSNQTIRTPILADGVFNTLKLILVEGKHDS